MPRISKGRPDPLQPGSPQFEERQRRNGHNACHGGVAMARVWMINIQERDSVTAQGKAYAVAIEELLDLLGSELKHYLSKENTNHA